MAASSQAPGLRPRATRPLCPSAEPPAPAGFWVSHEKTPAGGWVLLPSWEPGMPRRAPRTQRQPPLPGAPSAAEGARGPRAVRARSRGNLSPQGRAGKANSTVRVAPTPRRGEPLTALALPLGPHRPAGWPVAPCGRTPFPLPPPLGALPGEGPGPAFPSRRRDVAIIGSGAPSACQLACAQAQLGPQPPSTPSFRCSQQTLA